MITQYELRRTWFLLPSGRVDEIDMMTDFIGDADRMAQNINARYYWRRVAQNFDDMTWDWACYHNPNVGPVVWRRKKVEPFKIVRSPDISGAEMLCRAKAATT